MHGFQLGSHVQDFQEALDLSKQIRRANEFVRRVQKLDGRRTRKAVYSEILCTALCYVS